MVKERVTFKARLGWKVFHRSNARGFSSFLIDKIRSNFQPIFLFVRPTIDHRSEASSSGEKSTTNNLFLVLCHETTDDSPMKFYFWHICESRNNIEKYQENIEI
jgi:hypothetical protein